MAGGCAVPLSAGCAHCLEPRRCRPHRDGNLWGVLHVFPFQTV